MSRTHMLHVSHPLDQILDSTQYTVLRVIVTRAYCSPLSNISLHFKSDSGGTIVLPRDGLH